MHAGPCLAAHSHTAVAHASTATQTTDAATVTQTPPRAATATGAFNSDVATPSSHTATATGGSNHATAAAAAAFDPVTPAANCPTLALATTTGATVDRPPADNHRRLAMEEQAGEVSDAAEAHDGLEGQGTGALVDNSRLGELEAEARTADASERVRGLAALQTLSDDEDYCVPVCWESDSSGDCSDGGGVWGKPAARHSSPAARCGTKCLPFLLLAGWATRKCRN